MAPPWLDHDRRGSLHYACHNSARPNARGCCTVAALLVVHKLSVGTNGDAVGLSLRRATRAQINGHNATTVIPRACAAPQPHYRKSCACTP